MNHDEDDAARELFARLEADMNTDREGPAVAPGKAGPRAHRNGPDEESVYETGPVAVVDGPAPTGPGWLERLRAEKRRPVIPAWLRSKAEFREAARWVVGHYAHTAAFHGFRMPNYVGKLAARAPRGVARAMREFRRWTRDLEGEPIRAYAVAREDAELYLKLSRQRDRRVAARSWLCALLALSGAALVPLLVLQASGWALAALVATALLAFGAAGAPADQPLITRAVVAAKVQRLTSEMVERALSVLAVSGITQYLSKGGRMEFTAPITRDGPGWRADVQLPPGVIVGEVMDKRDKLASGLRRPLGCVWPEPIAGEHPGMMALWVGDQDMNKTQQPAWPLLTTGTVDLFKPAAFATDQRGRWVDVTLMFIAGVIGAIPRMGKTFLLRLLLLIAALDPRAELHTYDLKGTGDLDPVGEKVSHRHRAGEDDEDIKYALEDMRAIREELRRRAKVIRSLPRDICPESKVTSELADKKSLGLHPIVIGVDECQKWFEHHTYGRELEEICTDIVKRGPATGIILLLATQRPDAKSLPTGISANASVRLCLKVMGQLENDMVLGTSSYRNGIRATTFAWADKGIAYFVGEGADARIVRAVNIDAPAAETIATRARAVRERAGLLTGYAAGKDSASESGPSYDLLADILAVVPATEAKVWSETVVARLAELRPEVYHGWAPDQLTAAVKPYGIATGQVWGTADDGKGANRRGITRAHIAAVASERDRKPDAA
ncbi:S-DNA-T family DNA segregation ATPase FtsK/SpoIIIE [Kitasatospora sp. MAP12-15]|uniref:cell division protein FtsK n=1 Tax=unclassified Kitasatospora TaxID=2633591 RepID=UPI002475E7A6|nr:cell division protein FtsK [Kitasatospora sp. MAP12-44]MDH6111534.1 S-DNA-T family DNA segregation ATPase FtsK/SpoIIIE [Kitasatospora sp. MAP12-44]